MVTPCQSLPAFIPIVLPLAGHRDHSYHFSDTILLFHLHFQVLETLLHPVMEGPQVVRHPFLMDLNPRSQEGNLKRDGKRGASAWVLAQELELACYLFLENFRCSETHIVPRTAAALEFVMQGDSCLCFLGIVVVPGIRSHRHGEIWVPEKSTKSQSSEDRKEEPPGLRLTVLL